jgi:hypothetical protein
MNATVTPILNRRDLGKVRRASFWQQKADAAPDQRSKAAVSWDALRARAKRLPADERDQLWRQVAVYFNGLAPDTGMPRLKEEAS